MCTMCRSNSQRCAIFTSWSRVIVVALVTLLCCSKSILSSVEEAEESGIILTPWWNLTFGEGEMIQVDCGVHTGGKPEQVKMTWFDPKGQTLEKTDNGRIQVVRNDDGPIPGMPGAYSVLTLTISDLRQSDSGSYTCQVKWSDAKTPQRSIALDVQEHGYVYGFENNTNSQWKTNGTLWTLYNADHPVITSQDGGDSPRYDHTYGPSKTIGYFIKINPKVQIVTPGSSMDELISPVFPPHNDSSKCFIFWYMMFGKIKYFDIILQNEAGKDTTLSSLKDTTKAVWTKHNVTIPSTNNSYQIILKVDTCKTKCNTVAIDDLRLVEGSCEEADVHWPNNHLQVRLVNGTKSAGREEGRVEVLHEGQWGTVCGNKFGVKEAMVICRMKGYAPECAAKERVSTGAPKNQISWLDVLKCNGNEEDLADCLEKGERWGNNSCDQNQAKVFCSKVCPSTEPTTSPHRITTEAVPTSSEKTTCRGTIIPTMHSTISSNATEESHTSRSLNFTSETTTVSAASGSPQVSPEGGSGAVAAGIAIPLVLVAVGTLIVIYRRRKYGRKSNYITFNNPKYSREHLPTNENISLDSPLTWNTGHSVIA